MKTFQTFLFLLTWFSGLTQVDDLRPPQRIDFLDSSNFLPKEFVSEAKNLDFSSLWANTPAYSIYGIIGDGKQRIRIKILNIKKMSPLSYSVTGKSMVKDIVCSFSGTITVKSIRYLKELHWGVDDEFKDSGIVRQAVMASNYQFVEDRSQPQSGIFKGVVYTQWYFDKSKKIRYDDTRKESDGYSNNQFVGHWQKYASTNSKVCNWGDYRVPFAGDLDIGAGFFSPDTKYLSNGWKSYSDAYIYGNTAASHEEERDWWK
jgi:hypothetical protein